MGKQSQKSLADQLKPFVAPFRFDGTDDFHLRSHKTAEKGGIDKDKGEKIIEANRKRLADFQEKLYAQDRWSLLLIFQGMDAAGKDSAIKSVFDGVNPQGCEVTSFKQPSSKELDHDFLWRAMIALPERGRIGIFNRSLLRGVPRDAGASGNPAEAEDAADADHQEDLARALRGHYGRRALPRAQRHRDPEVLSQRVAGRSNASAFSTGWSSRRRTGNSSMGDIAERALWPKYHGRLSGHDPAQLATRHAPWHVVPADHKWFARVVIGSTIVSALDKLDLHFPKVDKDDRSEFKQVRQALLDENKKAAAAAAKKKK